MLRAVSQVRRASGAVAVLALTGDPFLAPEDRAAGGADEFVLPSGHDAVVRALDGQRVAVRAAALIGLCALLEQSADVSQFLQVGHGTTHRTGVHAAATGEAIHGRERTAIPVLVSNGEQHQALPGRHVVDVIPDHYGRLVTHLRTFLSITAQTVQAMMAAIPTTTASAAVSGGVTARA
ncbi:hypothetical protein [Curtobacterium phage Penoan]|nr:hypothetical protein [Curtobacterium phage Penoan]